ncbi:glycosyltransferase family 1 protein [Xylariaceae sp. AK1471]|nr:glycosyltransferase family 1 protein [Xylariaceae sp. AK1471]
MPPIELDKPPTAPIDANQARQDELEIRDAATDGQHGALLRGPSGSIAYPGYVPPGVESPTAVHQHTNLPDATVHADSVDSEPAKVKAQGSSKKRQRPSFNKFFTDAPRRTGRHASKSPPAPLLERAATNTSVLHNAILEAQDNDGSDGSSSSSSSEDENGNSPRRRTSKENQSLGRPKKKTLEDHYRRFQVGNENYATRGKVSRKDGRLNITLNDTSDTGYLAKTLGAAIQKLIPRKQDQKDVSSRSSSSRLSSITAASGDLRVPKLNIVIMVIGSRGDAQPFLKIGKVLKEEYGHRVRIATHPAFRDFVEKECGLEFFSVGGDPAELMAFMVKNPGMIPKLDTVKAGDIGRRRAAMAEMFDGFWRACVNATDNEKDNRNLKMMDEKGPFVADAIIANPPSFAHIHCAEALGVPLHLMFTFPYTPTQAFPHPLANIKKTNVDPGYTNFMSYPLVEMMVWQGLGDLVNDFRIKTLGLDPIHTLWAPGSIYRLHVPFSYLWSPGLVPKPDDWGHEIDISGFVFLDLASSFKPPQGLVDFLDAGEQPIYIGFGSIVVDDADKFTEMIFEAVNRAGVRALVSKGWGGLGQDNLPENIYMLENTPHDWLFPRVRACVIHGGAGTTAIALKCSKPTMIVPFFGDQHFWGAMVANAGAGPEPVPYKQLSAEELAEGIKYCLTEEASNAAMKLSQSIAAEGDGAHNAVVAFHRHLKLAGEESMRCSVLDDRIAAWTIKGTSVKLSPLAADIAVRRGLVSWRMLRLLRHRGWNDFEGPGEPVTGIAGSLMGTIGDVLGGIGSLPYRLAKTSNRRKERQRKNKRRYQKQKASTNSRKGSSLSQSRNAAQRGSSPSSMLANTVASGPGTPRTASLSPAQNEYFEDIQKGVGKSGRALARAPVDLSLALAQGFHNAPRLYGDTTVRQPIRVTGISSGLKAARDEFLYGIYDGFTGLVLLPYRGAKERGFKGILAGLGMGVIGFVLKDLAALFGPIAYTLQGIAKEISGGKHQAKHIRRARTVQGQRELQTLSASEQESISEEIINGWAVMRQLADIVMEGKGKRGTTGIFRRGNKSHGQKNKSLGKWGRGPAFESVETAKIALEAIRSGENMDEVLGKDKLSLDKLRDKRTLGQECGESHDVLIANEENANHATQS